MTHTQESIFLLSPVNSRFVFVEFQKPDGLPIHLKRGARDKVLYYIAVGGCFVGLAGIAEFIYSLP